MGWNFLRDNMLKMEPTKKLIYTALSGTESYMYNEGKCNTSMFVFTPGIYYGVLTHLQYPEGVASGWSGTGHRAIV